MSFRFYLSFPDPSPLLTSRLPLELADAFFDLGMESALTPSEADCVVVSPWYYTRANNHHDLNAWQAQLNQLKAVLTNHPTPLIIVLSSSWIYGMGQLYCGDCGKIKRYQRSDKAFVSRLWDELCPTCSELCLTLPFQEFMPLREPFSSFWPKAESFSKDILGSLPNRMCILRLFHPIWWQPRSSHAEECCLTFIERILSHQQPRIYEDGNQLRSFTWPVDIANACWQLLNEPNPEGTLHLNLSSGVEASIYSLIYTLEHLMNQPYTPLSPYTESFRPKDRRYAISDLSFSRKYFTTRLPYDGLAAGLSPWLAYGQHKGFC